MKNKGILASSVLLSLVLATVISAGSVKAAKGKVDRVGGQDRYETSAMVAKVNWKDGAKNVILASGETYADALSGSVLAKKLDAPILLTRKGKLEDSVKDAIKELNPENVFILGSEGAISKNVEDEVGVKVTRLQGKDRFETNIAIANYLVEKEGVDVSDVLVVNGEQEFSDGLSVAPVAAAKEKILLLVSNDLGDTKDAKNFVQKHTSKVTVVGNEAMVPQSVYKELNASERVNGGKDRFETNLNILKEFNLQEGSKIYFANATGDKFPDALVASALAGKFNSPLVLVNGQGANADKNAVQYVKEHSNKDTDLQALGSKAVIPDNLVNIINTTVENKGNTGDESSLQTIGDKEIINIKDSKLKETINHSIDKNRKADQEITKADMESLTEISGDFLPFLKEEKSSSDNAVNNHNRGIKSIDGLQYAVNLKSVDLSENEISDLSPLSNLTKIKWLEMDRNYIKDLSPLSKMTVLEHLNIYNNGGIVDLTPISKLKTIKWIDMHHCSRSEAPLNVEVLGNLVNLEYLSFETNKITDLSFVKSLPNLKTLSCNNTFVTDLEPVQDLAISAFNDWSGERFFNMFGQKLDAPFKIKANANGGEYRFKSPVKNYERYKAHVEKTLKEQYGEEVKAPAVNANDVDVDYLKFDFDHDTNEVVVKVDPNKTGKSRAYKVQILLDYGMYSLRENFEITQDDNKSISNVDEETIDMSQDIRKFYLGLFNKYNKYDKKYTNIVDDMASNYEKLPEDHIFTKGDMKKLKRFYDKDSSITKELVAPLKYATNLENFEVMFYGKDVSRTIEDFDFIKNCKNLKVLYYLNNGLDSAKDEKSQLKKISGLESLTNLEDLRINMTTLEDVTPISNLKLKYLVLPDNNIKEVNSTIGKITTLERLDIENNQVSDISAFKNLVNLRSSYLYNNKLSDISSLSALNKLEALLINSNNIENITPLKNLNLKRLYINGNPLPENYIDTVKGFSKVNTLKVSDISIDDFQWMKTFAVRDEDKISDLGENNARLYTFNNMPIQIKVSSTLIKDGILTIKNPLKGLNNEPVVQDEYDSEYKINKDITFKDDKIEIKMDDSSANSLKVKYQIYTENPEKIFGEYSQPASIVGTVNLNITIEK